MATTDPGLVPDPQALPSPEREQNNRIRPSSGLAIIGVFVEVIRKRFPVDSGAPWTWYNDPKKDPKNAILIESAFNEDKDVNNFRPAIYVDRDDMVLGRTAIGDFVGQDLRTGLKAFWALQTTPILIECIAAKKGESAILADLVGLYLHASSDLIQAKFGFHEMTPISVGRTQPGSRDKDHWVTSLTFNVQANIRWTNRPTGAVLAQIEADIYASGASSADEYFQQIVVSKLGL